MGCRKSIPAPSPATAQPTLPGRWCSGAVSRSHALWHTIQRRSIMNPWNRFAARFAGRRDRLGCAADATPSADEWLAAFTRHFLGQPDAEHGRQGLMSGLRFYTADFVAAI